MLLLRTFNNIYKIFFRKQNVSQRLYKLGNLKWSNQDPQVSFPYFLTPEDMSKSSTLPLVKYLIITIIFLLQRQASEDVFICFPKHKTSFSVASVFIESWSRNFTAGKITRGKFTGRDVS